jgi:hypothetical protein
MAAPVKSCWPSCFKTDAPTVDLSGASATATAEEPKVEEQKPVALVAVVKPKSCWSFCRSAAPVKDAFKTGTVLTTGTGDDLERAVVLSDGNVYVIWRKGLKNDMLLPLGDWLALCRAQGKEITVTEAAPLNLRYAENA